MSEFIRKLWGSATDSSKTPSERLTAFLGLVCPPLALLALLALLAAFVQNVLPVLLGGAFVGYLLVSDHVEAAISRRRLAQAQQDFLCIQVRDAVYRQIAAAIVPLVSQVVSMPLEPEDIFYSAAFYPCGNGIYFSTPKQLDEQERLRLRRLIINRLSGKTGIPRSSMYHGNCVLVAADYIFVRNDPGIIQYFCHYLD